MQKFLLAFLFLSIFNARATCYFLGKEHEKVEFSTRYQECYKKGLGQCRATQDQCCCELAGGMWMEGFFGH